MSEVVDHLAELTGFRDRDVLDVTLVSAFRDLLRPESVTIYRPVGESGAQRWHTRARLRAHEAAPSADSIWSELEDLPPLETLPAHVQCMSLESVVSLASEGQSVRLFPLTADRDASGVLEIRTREAMDEGQTRLVSSVLRVYRNFQGLLDYSERDTLTGLLNRKSFDGSFLRAAAQVAQGEASPCGPDSRRRSAAGTAWLGVADIDRFKRVNDTYGHLIGDEVLLLVARLMRSSFRYQDQLYRFGGEEFVVLLRSGGAEQAMHAFERLRANVENYVFPRVGSITLSVGFTRVRIDDSPADAFERADRAIYYAKQNGRNQVQHHGDLIDRGVLIDASRAGDMELF